MRFDSSCHNLGLTTNCAKITNSDEKLHFCQFWRYLNGLYLCEYVYESLWSKTKNQATPWERLEWQCRVVIFHVLGNIPSCILSLIQGVVFQTLTISDKSEKINVATSDQCHDGVNWKCVVCIPVHFYMRSWVFVHFGAILLAYMFACMYVSYNVHKRCTDETFLKGSNVYANVFMYLGIYKRTLLILIWEVVFWTFTRCFSTFSVWYSKWFCLQKYSSHFTRQSNMPMLDTYTFFQL